MKSNNKKIKELDFVSINDVKWYLKYLVWYWRNKKEVRKWMVNRNKISLDIHREWLRKTEKRIKDGKCSVDIVFLNGKPIGVCGIKCISFDVGKD